MRLESLKSLLKLKEQNIEVQRADYQRLFDIQHSLQGELNEHQQMIKQFISESQTNADGFTRDVLLQNRNYLELLGNAEKQLKAKVEQAGQLVKEAFSSLNETIQEYRVLERFFERTSSKQLAETLNTQFKRDDELALLAKGDRK
ncbi:hypothetical protein [Methylophilus methylotrophus]|uniref:hypothetical protein n=1 Tax=Methylophilus methylotrophus TaxID=17 RepID=UPI000F596172|nr:hypothetical protein [Methylophilus methylotrophus]